MSPEDFDALTKLCASDLVKAFKLPRGLESLAKLPARKFASEVREFDDCIHSTGLRAAGDFILDKFTAGQIEPDGASRTGAIESLQIWSSSVIVLAQRVASTQIVPVFVKGVLSLAATQLPVVKVFPDEKNRNWAAATLQILLRRYRDVHVSTFFGPPITGDSACLASAMGTLIQSSLASDWVRS